VGEDVESILLKLYTEAGQDVELAERGIIYIDEIDKVSRQLDTHGPLGKGWRGRCGGFSGGRHAGPECGLTLGRLKCVVGLV
jgi:hypothetical protein